MIVVFSPGRFNIIGEHTDHQNGLVIPACIQLGITLYGKKTEDDSIIIHSDTFEDTDIFYHRDFDMGKGWKRYTRGIIKKFKEYYDISGLKIWIESDMPISGGLSSSAALEVGMLYLLQNMYGLDISAMDLVNMAHFVETKFVGVNCGIMDQFIIRLGRMGNAIRLNCDNIEYEYVPTISEITFLLLNTGIERDLSSSDYNKRITELSYAFDNIRILDEFKNLNNISQLKIEHLDIIEAHLDIVEFKRVKHVITENDRVIKYSELISEERFEEAGRLIYQSHYSLKDNFEVSWSDADRLIELFEIEFEDIVHGARMVGAGWGGSVLIQILSDNKNKFIERYNGDVMEIKVSDGVKVIKKELTDELQSFFNI